MLMLATDRLANILSAAVRMIRHHNCSLGK